MVYRKWDFATINYSQPPNVNVSGSGWLEVSTQGEVMIEISLTQAVKFAQGYLSIIGKSVSGETMIAKGTMTNLTFGLRSSVKIKPLEVTIYENGVSESSQFDETSWHLKNSKILLGPSSVQIGNCMTTLQSIFGPSPNHGQIEGEISTILRSKKLNSSVVDLGEFQDDICRLLSLAQRCPALPVLKEFCLGGKLVFTVLLEPSGDYLTLQPLIEWYAMDTLEFIKSVYGLYVSQKVPYGLVTLFEYYWRSHVESMAEFKFLLASIFMETLKFNWAANVATNLDTDFKANGLVRGFKPRGAARNTSNLSFEVLLIETAKHLGYPCASGTFTFIDDRNCIFHSGLSSAAQHGHPSSWPVIRPELQKLYNQIDDLLLRILNYSGIIFEVDLVSGVKKVNFPSRTPAS